MKAAFAVAASCLALAGCRTANNERHLAASPQKRGELELPQPTDTGAPLALSGKDLAAAYGGSMLLWDKAVSADQIAAISTASVDGRLAKAKYADFQSDSLQPLNAKLLGLRQDDIANEKAIDDAVAKNVDSTEARELQRGLSSKWFNGRVDGLVAAHALDRAGAAAARDNFKGYCEYKLYELAVSRLVQLDYAERPTPLTMCEDYYVNERHMFAGASCAAAVVQGAAQANYFDCLWNDGVLKSQTFAALKANNPDLSACDKSGAKRAAAYEAWLASGLLKKILFDNDVKPIDNKTYAAIFAAELMTPGASGFKLTQLAKKKVGETLVYGELTACKQALVRADLATGLTDLPWAKADLKDLKFIAEVTDASAAKIALFPAKESDSDAVTAARTDVVSKLRLYSERNLGSISRNGAVLIPDVLVSVDDHYFNVPVHQSVDANAGNVNQVKAEPVFNEIFNLGRKLAPKELLQKEAGIASELKSIGSQIAAAQAGLDELFQGVLAANKEGIPALTSPGALVTAKKLNLTIRAQSDASGDRVTASFTVGASTRVNKGCLDLGNGGIACDTAADTTAGSAVPLTAMIYDPEAGKLVLQAPIDDADAFGLAQSARETDNPDFNDLIADQLNGRTFELEIYPNKVGANYEFVSGAARVKAADGTVEWEGAFSADDFRQ